MPPSWIERPIVCFDQRAPAAATGGKEVQTSRVCRSGVDGPILID